MKDRLLSLWQHTRGKTESYFDRTRYLLRRPKTRLEALKQIEKGFVLFANASNSSTDHDISVSLHEDPIHDPKTKVLIQHSNTYLKTEDGEFVAGKLYGVTDQDFLRFRKTLPHRTKIEFFTNYAGYPFTIELHWYHVKARRYARRIAQHTATIIDNIESIMSDQREEAFSLTSSQSSSPKPTLITVFKKTTHSTL